MTYNKWPSPNGHAIASDKTDKMPEAANVVLDDVDFIRKNFTKQYINKMERELIEELHQRLHRIEAALQTPASDGVLDDRSVDAFAVVFDGKIQPATATKYDHIAEEEAYNCRISGKDDADVIAVKIIPALKQSTAKDGV